MVLSKAAQGVMDGEENGQVKLDHIASVLNIKKEYGREEDDVLWPYRPGKKNDTGEGGR